MESLDLFMAEITGHNERTLQRIRKEYESITNYKYIYLKSVNIKLIWEYK